MSQARREGAKVKANIMGVGLVLTGLFEFLENCEEGDNVLEAAGKALRRTKLRGTAIKKASVEVNAAERLRKSNSRENA
jgi:hypothetical protein